MKRFLPVACARFVNLNRGSTGKKGKRPIPAASRRLGLEVLEARALLAADFVPGELLIQFHPHAAEVARASVLEHVSVAVQERLSIAATGAGELDLVTLPPGLEVQDAIRRLANNPAVAYAEPNWILTHESVSNDTHYTNGNLWGMYSDDLPSAVGPTGTTNQYGSQAEEAWAAGATGSQTVYVGIIDEGIQFTHPDLAANVWTNSFDPVDGVDNDGNGYIDDIHGWDFSGNNNTIYDGTSDDHGTHVTGTIGAQGGNGAGVAGVNWNVTYISGKFLGSNGGTIANAVKAIDYMTNLKVKHGLNIVATNNSWGGGGFSQALLDAITRGANENILFIAAAGNGGLDQVGDNNDSVASYPSNYNTTAGAGYDAVVAVAAITSSGGLASFSNYGAGTVDLGAPGAGIYSTLPSSGGSTYGSYSGTSMATPHVTGAAALYASTHPGASAAQIRQAILNSTTSTPSLNGKTATGGRLNVSALMEPSGPSLSISDVTQAETDAAGATFTFTVTLSNPNGQTVSVNATTANGTATADGVGADGDYVALPVPQTLTFLPNETIKTVTIVVNGDTVSEAHETFFVNLSGASGATIADGQGVGTIQNDDGALLISDVTKAEGNSSVTPFTFIVSLQNASIKPVTVDYATAEGTATAGGDYAAANDTLTFAAGQTSQIVTVNVTGDTAEEPDETFFVNLSNATSATIADTQGVGTISDDDRLPTISIGDVSKAEGHRGSTPFMFTITLATASTQTVTVNYVTANGTATTGDKDYTATSGTLTFTPGQTSKTVTVSVKGDRKVEGNETFFINLSSPTNATLADGQGQGTIVNDDSASAGSEKSANGGSASAADFASRLDSGVVDWLFNLQGSSHSTAKRKSVSLGILEASDPQE